MKQQLILSIFFFLSVVMVNGQEATIYGTIKNESNQTLELANVGIAGSSEGTSSDKNGKYRITIPAEKNVKILVSFIGYQKKEIRLKLKKGEERRVDHVLIRTTTALEEVVVEDKMLRRTTMKTINPKSVVKLPSVSGSIEALVIAQPGVATSNELSSQYNVRGGNFDENLVYVNGIEIYRPLLIRSGQQEGLSFLNSDLVSSVQFSAGGFNAKYGDKLSSVLDIKYKTPNKFAASVNLNLLGANGHVEGVSKNKSFSYLLGVRRKTNQYVLNSLPTKGDYKPAFTDIQTYMTYKLSKRWSVDLLGYYANNKYNFKPSDRETDFGNFSEALRLKIYFEGQEQDRFENFMGALNFTFQANEDTRLQWTVSSFRTIESETYDIIGQYWIGLVESNPGDEEFGEIVESRGAGTYFDHARNYLDAHVINAQHKGIFLNGNTTSEWGLKYQHETIDDELKEWQLIDSAFYTLPYNPNPYPGMNTEPQDLELNNFARSNNTLTSNRLSAYFQNNWNFDINNSNFGITAGVRANYWDLNKQFLLSPRAAMAYKPDWKNDILFRLAGGVYHQPAFYKELRDLDGNIHKNLKAQSSFQVVLGSDWNFTAWGRPFKYVTELYYKNLHNLIPYEVDNVRLRYYPELKAKGYAYGIDMKVTGEFVQGVDSWISLSLMDSKEDIEGDFYRKKETVKDPITGESSTEYKTIEIGYRPRPSRQNVVLNIFFQDYLPNNPTYKMHLNLMFATGIPRNFPGSKNYFSTKNVSAYRRVDIGFSKMIKDEYSAVNLPGFLKKFKNIWISLEVFNLFDIKNTASYIYVNDIQNRKLAVPNYLTERQINVKLSMDF